MKLKTIDKVFALSILVLLLTNPLTGGYVAMFMEYVFETIAIKGTYANAVATASLIVILVVKYRQANRVTVPPKTAKTQKAGKYIDYK